MSTDSDVPSRILQGLRSLAKVEKCEITEEPSYQKGEKRWLLTLRIDIDTPSEFVPTTTYWCALIDNCYPYGDIDFYPSKIGGIAATFPHQTRNEEGEKYRKWRRGKICLDTPIRGLGVLWQEEDPVGDAERRLSWHGRRAVSWVSAASQGALLKDGDPFELPTVGVLAPGFRIVHDEDAESLILWNKCKEHIGLVILDKPSDRNYRMAVSFEDLGGTVIRRSLWYSKHVGMDEKARRIGLWWKWGSVIVNKPWEAPLTWGELIRVGESQDIAVLDLLKMTARLAREKDIQYLLLGFPIPKYVGGPLAEMYWQTVMMPVLTTQGEKPPRGFRPGENGFWLEDRRTKLANPKKLEYINTENWHEDRLRARGGFAKELCDLKVILIGAGAVGSAIAEALARGGVKYLHVIDGDILKTGNLVRHTLTTEDIGCWKADALRKRLIAISPNIHVTHIRDFFPEEKERIEGLLTDMDMVIDCTASDHVLSALSQGWWSIPKIFVSLSLGFMGKRMFFYLSDGMDFRMEAFSEEIGPWLDCERQKLSLSDELIEGVGCWSPLFPCRFDDITLASSIAVKVLEKAACARPFCAGLFVFEQQENSSGIPSYVLIESPKDK